MPDMSMFGILNTALTGIHAHKLAMNVVGHNIANASTPGYSRQRPVIEANPPHSPHYPDTAFFSLADGNRCKG